MATPRRRAWRWAAATAAVATGARLYATRRYFQTAPGPAALSCTRTSARRGRLRRSAVFRGDGVPRGDGAPVLLVQGFLTRRFYLGTLRAWLERLGYRARVAETGWNADCYDVSADRVMAELESLSGRAGRRVH